MSAKPDGTDLVEVYSIARYLKGLYVTATHVYWTEWGGTAIPEVFRVVKKQLTGGAAQVLASQTGRSFNNLAADDIHSVASELRRVSVDGGRLTTD